MLEKNKIASIFYSLLSLNFANLILPILMIPYLVSTLGTENYGVIAYHQYISILFLIIFDAGFQLYAVSVVTKYKNNKKKLSQLSTAALIIKFSLLLFFSTLIIILFKANQDTKGYDKLLTALYFINAFILSILPIWLFQGLDKAKLLVLPVVISKLLSLIFVVIFVKTSEQIYLIPLIQIFNSLGVYIYSLHLLKNQVSFAKPKLVFIKLHLFRSLQIYWSRLLAIITLIFSPLIIQNVAGFSGVAVYSIAEKILNLLRIPFDVAANSIHSSLANAKHNINHRSLLRKFLIAGILITSLIFLGAKIASIFLINTKYYEYLLPIAIFSLALIPISVHTYLGLNILILSQYRNTMSLTNLYGYTFYFLFLILCIYFNVKGYLFVIFASVFMETAILISRMYFVRKHKLLR